MYLLPLRSSIFLFEKFFHQFIFIMFSPSSSFSPLTQLYVPFSLSLFKTKKSKAKISRITHMKNPTKMESKINKQRQK